MTNDEFKHLILLEKHFAESNICLTPAGEKAQQPIHVFANSTKDIFLIDTDRKSNITISKKKLQERHANSNTMMIRLEIDCKPHMFSDGSLSSRNHIHIFDEENGNITYDLDGEYGKLFTDLNNFTAVFIDFCKMCNIDTGNVFIEGVM